MSRRCWIVFLVVLAGLAGRPVTAGLEAEEPDGVRSGYVDVDGGRIFYETAGQGPAVVMIHDGLLHRETWNGQFSEFAATHRVIRYDRRGFGKSPKPTAPFSQLDDLHALLEALGVEKTTVIGCSSGGRLAMEYTLVHPDRVSSLVLVGPVVSGFGFTDHFRTRGGRGMPGEDASIEQQIDYWSEKDPWTMAPGNRAARKEMKRLMMAHPDHLAGSHSFVRRPGFRVMGRLSEIAVPTLIVVGESDIPDVHAHVGVIDAGIGNSRREVLAGGGHLIHFEQPEPFNRLVLEFFGSVK